MEQPTLRLEYVRGDVEDAQKVQDVVDLVLAELQEPDSAAAREARAAGLDPEALSQAAVDVQEGQHGAEPVATTILVGIAVAAGSEVAKTLWNQVIWPRIQKRLGSRALLRPAGEEV